MAVPDLIKNLTDFLTAGELPSVLRLHAVGRRDGPGDRGGHRPGDGGEQSSASTAEISLAKAGRTLGFNLRGALFAHLQRLPLAFHLRRSTGDVLTRITGDVKAMEDFVEDSVGDLVGSVLILAATLAYLFRQSWQVALLAIAIVPLLHAGLQRVRPADQVRVQAVAGQRGRSGLHGPGDAHLDQPRPGLRPGCVRGAEVRAAEQLGAGRGAADGAAGGDLQLHRRRPRGRRHRGRHPGRRPAGVVPSAERRGSDRVHPADPEHVQADPPDHQAVEQGRGRLRQRGAGQRAARPAAHGGGRARRPSGASARAARSSSGTSASPTSRCRRTRTAPGGRLALQSRELPDAAG